MCGCRHRRARCMPSTALRGISPQLCGNHTFSSTEPALCMGRCLAGYNSNAARICCSTCLSNRIQHSVSQSIDSKSYSTCYMLDFFIFLHAQIVTCRGGVGSGVMHTALRLYLGMRPHDKSSVQPPLCHTRDLQIQAHKSALHLQEAPRRA